MFGCTVCPAGHESCPRCSRALCGEHVPFNGEACAECELAYHDEKSNLRSGLWLALGVAVPWLVFAAIAPALPDWSARSGGPRAITTGIPMLDVIVVFAFTSVFAGKAMLGVRRALHRRAFMRPLPLAPARTLRRASVR